MQRARQIGRMLRIASGRTSFALAVMAKRLRLRRAAARFTTIARNAGYDPLVRSFLDDLDALLDNPPRSEAEFSSHQRNLRDADLELERFLDSGYRSHRAYRLHALLADARGDHRAAAARWRRVLEDEGAAPRAESLERVVSLLHRLGESDQARAVLAASPADVRSAKLVREAERLIDQHRGMEQAANELQVLVMGDEPDPTTTGDQLIDLLGALGIPGELHGVVSKLLLRCERFVRRGSIDLSEQRDDPQVTRSIQQRAPDPAPTCIFCAGFGWSGSGAVADFLRDRSDVREPYRSPELLLFRGNWGNRPFNDLISDARGGTLKTAAVVECLLTSVLGVAPRNVQGARFHTARRKSVLGHLLDRPEDAVRVVEGCDELLDNLEGMLDGGCASMTTLLSVYALFLQRCFYLDVPKGARFLLFDNAVHPGAMRSLSILPSSVVLVVTRDPRDQFASIVLHRATPAEDLTDEIERFAGEQRRMLEQFADVIDMVGPNLRIRPVRFEDFVTKADARDDLLRFLGADPAAGRAAPARRRFDPESSAQNIGMHPQVLLPDDAAKLLSEITGARDAVHRRGDQPGSEP